MSCLGTFWAARSKVSTSAGDRDQPVAPRFSLACEEDAVTVTDRVKAIEARYDRYFKFRKELSDESK
jgi:hypothetical protein